jgi:hypothetical protein
MESGFGPIETGQHCNCASGIPSQRLQCARHTISIQGFKDSYTGKENQPSLK